MDQATARCARNLWIIILAAGASRRLGTSKQLLQVRGKTLLAQTITRAANISPGRVLTVLGAEYSRMRAHIRRNHLPTRCVYNRDWALGMGRSLATGVRALPRTADVALVLLCDQPRVGERALRRLLKAGHRDRNAIIASRYAGRLGVPAAFPRRAFEDLRKLDADQGARALLNEGTGRFRIIPVEMPEAAVDIDTPAHAAALKHSATALSFANGTR
jgi:molybdenum cofactor cytidylyltransferase